MLFGHLKAKVVAFPAWAFCLPVAVLILAAILAPLGGHTNEDPTGGANSMAPILALSAVAITILRGWLRLEGLAERLVKTVTSVGLLFSAYFWLAAESEVYPYSTQLIGQLGLLAAVIVGATVLVLFPHFLIWILTPQPEDN